MMSFHRVLINIMKLHLIVNVPIHYQIQLYYLDFQMNKKKNSDDYERISFKLNLPVTEEYLACKASSRLNVDLNFSTLFTCFIIQVNKPRMVLTTL